MRARRQIGSGIRALALGCALALAAAAPAVAATPAASQASNARALSTTDSGNALPLGHYHYQWQRCSPGCADLAGATAPSLPISPGDIGATYRSLVTPFSALESPTAAPTPSNAVTVQPRPPVKVVSPVVTGTASSGSTLSGSPGIYSDPTGGGLPTIATAWYRCPGPAAPPSGCVFIAANTGSITLGAADVGSYIHYVVVASAFGQTVVDTVRGPVTGPPVANPPATKPPAARPSRLRPFPVIVVAGRLSGGITRITNFTVKGPRGARVAVRCSGKRGCPFRRARTRTIPRSRRLRIPALQRLYGVGAVLEIRVTKGRTIGKYTRLRFRPLAAPARLDRCLMPGARKPSRCS